MARGDSRPRGKDLITTPALARSRAMIATLSTYDRLRLLSVQDPFLSPIPTDMLQARTLSVRYPHCALQSTAGMPIINTMLLHGSSVREGRIQACILIDYY